MFIEAKNYSMKKIDFKKELKQLYRLSPKKVEFIDVPEINFLMTVYMQHMRIRAQS